MYTDKMWSIEAYYRLMLLDILPSNVKRMFYFDVDIIVNKSLEDFYNINFEGNDLAACEDDCGNCVPEHYGPMHKKYLVRKNCVIIDILIRVYYYSILNK